MKEEWKVKASNLNGEWLKPDIVTPERSICGAKKRLTPGASILHFHAPRWFPFNPNRVASSGELASRGTAHRYRAKLGDHRPSLRTCFTTPTTHPYRVSPKKCTPTMPLEIGKWKSRFLLNNSLVYAALYLESHATPWLKLNRRGSSIYIFQSERGIFKSASVFVYLKRASNESKYLSIFSDLRILNGVKWIFKIGNGKKNNSFVSLKVKNLKYCI